MSLGPWQATLWPAQKYPLCPLPTVVTHCHVDKGWCREWVRIQADYGIAGVVALPEQNSVVLVSSSLAGYQLWFVRSPLTTLLLV